MPASTTWLDKEHFLGQLFHQGKLKFDITDCCYFVLLIMLPRGIKGRLRREWFSHWNLKLDRSEKWEQHCWRAHLWAGWLLDWILFSWPAAGLVWNNIGWIPSLQLATKHEENQQHFPDALIGKGPILVRVSQIDQGWPYWSGIWCHGKDKLSNNNNWSIFICDLL